MTKPTLPLLGLMPLLVASLGACTPSTTASDAPMASTAESAAAPTADAAATQRETTNWAMPEPGPFDPNATAFKPCTDIPDEVFAELGLEKRSESGETFEPYGCDFEFSGENAVGVGYYFANYASTLEEMLSGGRTTVIKDVENIPGAVLAVNNEMFQGQNCEILVENRQGTFDVVLLNITTGVNPQKDCQPLIEITETLFERS